MQAFQQWLLKQATPGASGALPASTGHARGELQAKRAASAYE
jgi:hypothetical protein